jgi:hypothetical protein
MEATINTGCATIPRVLPCSKYYVWYESTPEDLNGVAFPFVVRICTEYIGKTVAYSRLCYAYNTPMFAYVRLCLRMFAYSTPMVRLFHMC